MSEVETTTVTAPIEGQPAAVDTSLLGSFAPAEQQPNVLQQPVVEQPVVTDPAAPDFGWLPEKFHAKNDTGVLDVEASARKLAESYNFLEKKAGTGDMPPATPADYSFEMEGVDWATLKADPGINGFLTKAHEMGMTQKQMSFAMSELIQTARDQSLRPADVSGYTPDKAMAELRQTWAEPAIFNQNMSAANAALRGLIPKEQQQDFQNRYGNDPVILKLMAQVGTEFGEDRLANFGAPVLSSQSIEQMMQSDAYSNPANPEHVRVQEQVSLHFQRLYGN